MKINQRTINVRVNNKDNYSPLEGLTLRLKKMFSNDSKKIPLSVIAKSKTATWQAAFARDAVSTRSLTLQLKWCEDWLSSSEHRERTPTTYYGPQDPRRAMINSCICSPNDLENVVVIANYIPDSTSIKEYYIECRNCLRNTEKNRRKLNAIFAWNLSKNSISLSYKTIIFFDLGTYEPHVALERIKAIDSDLCLKIQVAQLKKKIVTAEPNLNSKYGYSRSNLDRLVCYREHARYSQSLIKLEINQQAISE